MLDFTVYFIVRLTGMHFMMHSATQDFHQLKYEQYLLSSVEQIYHYLNI